jgi:hypothetical protein
MKSAGILLLVVLFMTNNIFSQALPGKPTQSEVGAYNQANLLKVDIGATKNQVINVMGGVQTIQTYTGSNFLTRKKSKIIPNPFSRDFKTDQDGNTVEVLWYYTDINKADGAMGKDEQTPIVLEKNAVVGMGWDFYTSYAKRKGFETDAR